VKLLFDSQIFDWQISGGISRYFIELFHRLDKEKSIDLLFKVNHSYNTYIQGTKWLKSSPKFTNVKFKGKLRIVKGVNEYINRKYSNNLLKKGTQDLFHPTYYDTYFLQHIGKRPFVLTVYDLTHELYFAKSASTDIVLASKKKLIEGAHHIISISENTKKDIIEHYNIPPDKITTVYLSGGFDEKTSDTTITEVQGIPKDYILFVGSRSNYKNFLAFVKEAAPVLIKHKVSLVVAGGGDLNGGEAALLKELNIWEQTVALSHVSDVLLQKLYKNAMLFVFPSLYEGFGIPVLESMQCKCPALLSNNSSLPEVGGDAAVYFDPLVQGDLQSKLELLIPDETKRKSMVEMGTAQATKFNWDHTAQRHIEVYNTLAANPILK
jgi:glycosyltransferase involved in cell wall biosynthesis